MLFLLVLFCLHGVEAKKQSTLLRISGRKRIAHWKYLSKFGYGSDSGSYGLRLKLHQPKKMSADVDLQLEVYTEADWAKVQGVDDICERANFAKRRVNVTLNATGDFGEWLTGSLDPTGWPAMWYFALSDCQMNLRNLTTRIRFEFEATQADGSEFSVERRWMTSANVLYLVGKTGFVYFFVQSTRNFFRSAGNIHPVIITLALAIGTQYVAQVFHTVHLVLYRSNGYGIKALEVLSEILNVIGHIVLTSLIILIALGYTLLQSRIGELDLIIPLCFIIGVFHILLVTFAKIKDDASYQYHENEGAVGWIVLGLRVAIFLWFLWAVRSSQAEAGRALRDFLTRYLFAGTAYFLSYPIMFVVIKIFPLYLQYPIMTVGMMIIQLGSNVWLGTCFLTRGEYFKVSTLSASELPGGTKIGIVKAE